MSDHVAVTDPQDLAEAQARIRAINSRNTEAARRLIRQQAVAPMVLDDEPEAVPPSKEDDRDDRAERAAAILRGDVPTAGPSDIIRAVAFQFGFTYADLVGPSHKASIVSARWAAIHAVRRLKPAFSTPKIGKLFGGRDHTTIRHAILKMEREGVPQPPTSLTTGDAR